MLAISFWRNPVQILTIKVNDPTSCSKMFYYIYFLCVGGGVGGGEHVWRSALQLNAQEQPVGVISLLMPCGS